MHRKQKPDLLTILAIVVALGVIGSSVAQGMFATSNAGNQVANASPQVSVPR